MDEPNDFWKISNFFLLMVFWKFQHFNLVSKISQKLFKPLPCHKSIGKMLHAICISAVAVSLRWASCGLWASCFLFTFLLKRRPTLKGKNLLIPFRVDPFSEGPFCAGKQTGSLKNCLVKNGRNLPCVSSPHNSYTEVSGFTDPFIITLS